MVQLLRAGLGLLLIAALVTGQKDIIGTGVPLPPTESAPPPLDPLTEIPDDGPTTTEHSEDDDGRPEATYPPIVCDYSVVMPATIWLGSSVEANVHVNQRSGNQPLTCALRFEKRDSVPNRGRFPFGIGPPRDFIDRFRRRRQANNEFTLLQSVTFTGTSKKVTIQTPETGRTGHSALELRVSGSCMGNDGYACVISNSTQLHVEKPRANVMIELDKPVYKPAQRIKGRVLAVDGRLRPLEGMIPLLYISDAKKSRVAQWHDVKVTKGLASFSLPLSSEPVLGDWKVTLENFAGVDEVASFFKVDEYVLPKFDVNVELPKCLSSETSEICAEIDAKHTHGKPVKGTVDVLFALRPTYRLSMENIWFTSGELRRMGFGPKSNESFYGGYVRAEPQSYVVQEKLGSEDTTRVCMPLRELKVMLRYRGTRYRNRNGPILASRLFNMVQIKERILRVARLEVDVNVTETATGTVRNVTEKMNCYHNNPFQLEFVSVGTYWQGKFHPGLPLKAKVVLSRRDGKPVGVGAQILVTCKYAKQGSYRTDEKLYNRTLVADAAGRVQFQIDQVPCEATTVSCNANYNPGMKTVAYKSYQPLYSPTGSFLTLPSSKPHFQLGNTVRVPLCFFTCHVAQDIFSINYVVNARGHLVHSGSLDTNISAMGTLSAECNDTDANSEKTAEPATVPLRSEGSGDDDILTNEVTDKQKRSSPPRYFPQLIIPQTQAVCPCQCRKTCDLVVEFRVTSGMGPSGKLTVHTTLSTGEIVVDTVDFTVSSIFENQVSLSFDHATYRPGQQAHIQMKAAPGSTLAYSAVDKSLHILGGNNQITPSRANEALDLRGGQAPYLGDMRKCPRNPYWGRKKRSSIGYYPYSSSSFSDALDSWSSSNMVIITSNRLATRPCPVYRPYRYEYSVDKNGGGLGDGLLEVQPTALFELPPMTNIGPQPGALLPPPAPSGPIADSAPQPPNAPPAPVVISSKRSFFPETWLFKTLEFREDQASANISVKVPDTITSWSAAAYAVSTEMGLGVASPQEITVFQPFFLSMKLPYSVLRGEIVELPISVFNYVPGCTAVSVELLEGKCYTNTGGLTTQELCLCSDDVDTVRFNVSFNVIGDCPIVAIAKTGGARECLREGEGVANVVAVDRVTRKMKVEPAGVEMENVESRYEVKKAHDKPFSVDFAIEAPEDIVADSGRAWLSIVGDLLGPSLDGLENLLKLPYGCGEQNMLNFAPGISIAKYLIETNQLDRMPQVKAKATEVLLQGYQRENRYRHGNGAFSAFGESSWKSKESSGCLWLTSFVVKSYCKAKTTNLISVDERQICESAEWIVRQQNESGAFVDDGCLHHKAMMGGAQTTYSYTSYICLGLIELMQDGCNCSSRNLERAILRCKAYLTRNLDTSAVTPYASAITCYGLTLGGSPAAASFCKHLDDGRKEDHWEQEHVEPKCSFRSWSCHRRQPSANVEITAYGLLANLQRRRSIGDSLSIAKWLAAQRNSYGGFSSTQDTVVALSALARLGSQLYSFSGDGDRKLKLTYRYKAHNSNAFDVGSHSIDQRNNLVVFKRELRPVPGTLSVRIRGAGSALLQVATRYNVREEAPLAAFRLRPTVEHLKEMKYSIGVCTQWLRNDTDESNMALVTIKLPSGYVAMPEELDELKKDSTLQLERWDIDGREVFFYFESIGHKEMCFKITVDQDMLVDKRQPTYIRVQDYYEPEHEATVEYTLEQRPSCPADYVYDACDTSCGPVSCRQHLAGNATEECRKCVAGCRCKDNYVRLGDKCVRKSECKEKLNLCPQNQVYDNCGTACPRTCADVLNPRPRICPLFCVPGCVCTKDHVLESLSSNTCVQESSC